MGKRVLITGGSGLIGRHLIKALLKRGYDVNLLSRKNINIRGVKSFTWDVYNGSIDKASIEDVDSVIHLAGEGIADKPWTNKRKQDIIISRTRSIELIYQLLAKESHKVGSIISASGVGFYGNRGDEILSEEKAPGKDFLAESCIEWEKAVDEGKKLGLRVVKLRTGVVLSTEGGALPKLAGPVKFGIGAALGNGKQWMPWLHLDDMVNMYVFALENESVTGAFNAAAPEAATNHDITKTIAKILGKPLLLPNVPSFALRFLLGEMCAVVLNSTKTSADKIVAAGYSFQYEELEEALREIYGK